MNSYRLISNLFVPERVTNRICIAPWPDASAPALAVVSVHFFDRVQPRDDEREEPVVVCSRLLLVMPSIVMLN